MQRNFFPKNFYTESLTLFYCVPFRIFFLEPTKLSLTCPASIYGIVKRMTETGEQVERVILIFEFLENLI